MKKSAIIGFGVVAQIHLAAILANPEITLSAVCDIDPNRKDRIPEGVPFFTDYRQLCEEVKPDCVHICLPHYLHFPVTKYFVEQGVNVFCEKPIAMNAAEAEAFVQLEAAHPEVKICVCLQNRLNETTELLKEMLDSGEYGKILGCRGFVPWMRDESYYSAEPWRGKLETAGGGCMMNQSIHTLDLLYFLCGEITALHGTASQLLDIGIEVEDTVTARLEFESGAKGLFFATNCNYANESVQIKVVTEKASFLIMDDKLSRTTDGKTEILCENAKMPGKKFYFGASHSKLIAKFYCALEADSDDYIHVKDAQMSIRLIEAVHRSQKAGRPVRP